MITLSAPPYVLQILTRLESAGHRAWLVGGCVRDLMMQKPPTDWDICTDALPAETIAVFPVTKLTGLQHGTVSVYIDENKAEVTTLRAEKNYSDHRRPDSVRFVQDIQEDLQRRDFTINAMAWSMSGKLVDPFGGLEDMERRVVRCVGDAVLRFSEDALRMFRAVRFSATLDFSIAPATLHAMQACAGDCAFLAAERIRDEVQKILMSPSPERLETTISLGHLNAFLNDGCLPNLETLKCLPFIPRLRWSGLAALLSQCGRLQDTEAFFKRLRLSGSDVRSCVKGVENAGKLGWISEAERKRQASQLGEEAALCLAASLQALGHPGEVQAMQALLDSGACLRLDQLKVDGNDLRALGFSGRAVGSALQVLLDHVLECPEDNDRSRLMALSSSLPRSF